MSQEVVRHLFPKNERLCSQKRIDALFSNAESFIAYPLRIVYILKEDGTDEEGIPLSTLVSVSKKRLKRAVKRNRVKRLIREAYRLNKQPLAEQCVIHNKQIDIAFLYLKNELPDYPEIEKAIQKTITVLINRISEKKE
ncbi:MAG: ribonuclease P protein component [Dysgonomonas sp.]|nr:ribonuclease P protein component [Dysgonomonas sp.]